MGPFVINATGVGATSRVFIPTSQYTYDAGVSYTWMQALDRGSAGQQPERFDLHAGAGGPAARVSLQRAHRILSDSMQHHFTALDTLVLAAYFVGTMGIGLFFQRKSRSVEGFTVASRNMPGWLCGLSILGAYVSSISFLAFPGKAFAGNWNPFVFSLSLPLATWIGVKWFMPFYRRSGHVSAYTHLEERFGAWARMYASSCFILHQIVRVAMITYLMALPLNVLLGWDMAWVIVLTTVLTTVFCVFSAGLWR